VRIIVLSVLFTAGLAWAFVTRVRNMQEALRGLDAQLDPSSRPLGLAAACAAVGATLFLFLQGLELPAAVVVGLLGGAGVFAAGLGVRGQEGLLLETESETATRRALGLPPPTSRRGRCVAMVIGALLVLGSLVLCGLVGR
jgi:hypothetical protein